MSYAEIVQAKIINSGTFANDAFGRLRTSEPFGIFEATCKYGIPQHLFSTLGTNGGTVTHNANTVSAILTATTTTNSRAVIQSRRYVRYAPGRSQIVYIQMNFEGTATDVIKRAGLYDDNNGLFFELNGTVPSVNVRSKTTGVVVDNKVIQSNWNRDKLDGTGPSGITLDFTKNQLLGIDFTWLGLGHVRFGFDLDGAFVCCHEYYFSNYIATPYSQTGTLPIRAEIINTVATTSFMSVTCANVIAEGEDINNSGVFQTVNTGTSAKAIGGATFVPLLILRKKTAFLDLPIRVNSFNIVCESTDNLLIELWGNPATITGASWVDSNTARCEYDISASAITGGTLLYSDFIKGSTSNPSSAASTASHNSQFFLGSDLNGNSDVLVVGARSMSGAATASAVIHYLELVV